MGLEASKNSGVRIKMEARLAELLLHHERERDVEEMVEKT